MRAFVFVSIVTVVGCHKKLPDQLPYRVEISRGEDTEPTSLLGLSLVHGDKVLGTIGPGSNDAAVWVDFTGSKQDVRGLRADVLSVRRPTACGTYDEPLTPLWATLAGQSESELAEALDQDAVVKAAESTKKSNAISVMIDWGTASSIAIGTLTIARPKARDADETRTDLGIKVLVDGCKTAPTITVGGNTIGTLALDAPIQLVAVADGVCYVKRDRAFGDATSKAPDTVYAGKHVYALVAFPDYFLMPAPASIKLSGTGAVVAELVTTACP